ncbi:MAG: hypothetical protein A3J37_00890 [Alphaproteobacteria bacterium RIFCSPHIGHO2_12_FULL_45_9]|nr:MAG: hypothetical protein A3B66_04850 [Alphaproteobacteria bacterium RIFCSPHIGHO2_02_FULL_46_13]OFW98579.1 MAG: hypothetical protein A3J37_00890 [Alphaproteobacteria bacterium RIFCSPHIGHO2_12_FULL_45_9]
MSGSKNISLAAKLSGLALCTFMTACGQSSSDATVPQAPASSPDKVTVTINQQLINMASDFAKKNTTPSEGDCRYMLASTLTTPVQQDKSEAMNTAKDIIFNICPN